MNGLDKLHINEIKYRFNYKINETPRYRPLVGIDEEFDEVPGNEPTDEVKPDESPEAPIPDFAEKDAGEDIGGEEPIVDAGATNPEVDVERIQNDIIKHNIEAMKGIHQELQNLNNTVQGLNQKIETLNSEVDEVKEPTDAEKLMNKSEKSYPYYFNLNDLWSDNWFQNKRESEKNGAIKMLPDGTYVADFDDLMKYSDTDVKNSFNNIV